VLGEVLIWIGVAIASMVVWALYAVGENAPRRRVQREDLTSDG